MCIYIHLRGGFMGQSSLRFSRLTVCRYYHRTPCVYQRDKRIINVMPRAPIYSVSTRYRILYIYSLSKRGGIVPETTSWAALLMLLFLWASMGMCINMWVCIYKYAYTRALQTCCFCGRRVFDGALMRGCWNFMIFQEGLIWLVSDRPLRVSLIFAVVQELESSLKLDDRLHVDWLSFCCCSFINHFIWRIKRSNRNRL